MESTPRIVVRVRIQFRFFRFRLALQSQAHVHRAMVRGPYAIRIRLREQQACFHRLRPAARQEHVVHACGRLEVRRVQRAGAGDVGAGIQAQPGIVPAGLQRGQFRCIGFGVEVAGQQRGGVAGGGRHVRQQVGDLLRTGVGTVGRPVEMGEVEVERVAVDQQADEAGGAVVFQRMQQGLAFLQQRMAGQQGHAVTALVAGWIGGDEPPFVAELVRQPCGLVGQRLVLQHFLQHDRVGLHFAQGVHDLHAPLRPVAPVVVEVEGDQAEFRRLRRRGDRLCRIRRRARQQAGAEQQAGEAGQGTHGG